MFIEHIFVMPVTFSINLKREIAIFVHGTALDMSDA
jgi:hypothetical protein